MEHSALAYLANGTLVVAPVIRTTTGLGSEVESSALGSLDQSSIAEALSKALGRSGRVVPHPRQPERMRDRSASDHHRRVRWKSADWSFQSTLASGSIPPVADIDPL